MSFENIPAELQQLPQWVVWKYEKTDTGKDTKVPFNPRTNMHASHADPRTWASFNEACAAVANGGYDGIGFVFTEHDDYCGIDLDATDDPATIEIQKKILFAFESYNEFSPSGEGLHIIIKARLPHGRKRAGIEIYPSLRFFTMTGRVYIPAPILERQQLAQQLWEEMGAGASPDHYQGDHMPKAFTEEVIEQMRRAKNGPLFEQLWAGDISDYPSHSEADQALMNIIVFHTKNRRQAMEIFRMSGLGKRDKARRDKYLDYTINRAFDQTLPPIDVSVLVNQIQATIAANKPRPTQLISPTYEPQPQQVEQRNEGFDLTMWKRIRAPGLIGDIQQFVLAASPRPVSEIALTAAIGLVAGISARAFNVSGEGLNVYLMMLAETGRGKEAMGRGINKLMSAVAGADFPAAWDFLGPSDMASGSGLLRHLSEHPQPCFLSLTGEIGMRLQQMANPNADLADKQLQRVLLDLYAKSGAGISYRATVYADKKNNVPVINSPNFVWLGESTPSEFYKALNEYQISSGLLPRFLIIEYDGPRVADNEQHVNAYPPKHLTETLRNLVTMALEANRSGKVVNVGMTSEAADLSRLINLYCDHKINEYNAGPLVHLWNRAHINMLKIAALLAVSANHYQPVVDKQMIEWANSLVMSNVFNLMGKFERGEVGQSSLAEAFAVLARGVVQVMEGRKTLKPTDQQLANDGVLSRSLLSQMTSAYVVFKADKRLFGEVMAELEKQGVLYKLSKQDCVEKYSSRAELYQVSNAQWFYDHLQQSF